MIRLAFGFAVLFALCGLLIVRGWGWSEYASDELYVIAARTSSTQLRPNYVLINTLDLNHSEPLTWSHGAITELGCSPDGRTLAFLTDSPYMYVITERGLAYEHPANSAYGDVYVHNNQSVEIFRSNGDSISVTASGTSTTTAYSSDQPLAPEQIVLSTYGDRVYLKDGQTHQAMRVLWNLRFVPPISPDGTKIAVSANLDVGWRVRTVDFMRQDLIYVLTGDYTSYVTPICFLTFRPDMLMEQ